jgi:hypothetical protein
MGYKPKYCCECGDKVERANWNFFTSRRFCDVCETGFKQIELLAPAALIIATILSVFSVGIYLRRPEKNAVALLNQQTNASLNLNRNAASQTIAPANEFNRAPINAVNADAAENQTKPAVALKTAEKNQSREIQTSVESQPQEAVYFCGAQTKKGTPCTRRVKGGGRCWQHTGQPAMLPQTKLIAN